MKNHDQKQIREECLALAYSYRGIEYVMAKKSWWMAAMFAGVGSLLITFLPNRKEERVGERQNRK